MIFVVLPDGSAIGDPWLDSWIRAASRLILDMVLVDRDTLPVSTGEADR